MKKLDELTEIIRPYVIKALHEKKINDYITTHKELHGNKPTKEQLSYFISLIIGNGIIIKETDTFIKELFNEVITHYRSFSIKNLFFSDSTLMLLVFGLSVNNILLFLSKHLHLKNLQEDYFTHPSILVPSLLLLFLSIYHFFSIFKDRKK